MQNKRDIKAAKKGALGAIKTYKADMKDELREYKRLSRVVNDAYSAYDKARDLVSRRPGTKNEKRLSRAEESYRFARSEFERARVRINNILASVEREYSKLMDTYRARGNMKAAERAHIEHEEYRESVLSALDKSDTLKPAPQPKEETPALDAPELDAQKMPARDTESPVTQTPPQKPAAVTSTVTSVTVAPVTIDITPIVERAIDSFIERLDIGLARRLEEYTGALELPRVSENTVNIVPVPATTAPDGGAVTELGAELLEEEEHIAEKLRTMCSSISTLLDELTSLSSAYHDISLKCRELAEIQRTLNDMQRHTAREMKGVQVNQKLVADEQAELIAAETLVVESQRELIERERAVADMQKELTALAAENADAVRAAIERERELTELNGQLVLQSKKLHDAADQALSRQSELYLEQKEALSRTKKLAREQKQLGERLPKKKSQMKREQVSEESFPDDRDTTPIENENNGGTASETVSEE